ncbi:TIR domain-containing protein [Mesorhizobium sp. ANAO-SY3R2]|uniref:TIR domain-containing protein n=1 Tax=Mesorhizobium sp. ANAO-SY3R2 TaxID=3166644 RepID=UPI00366A6808
MGLFTETELRNVARSRMTARARSAGAILKEDVSNASTTQNFDVFLSHSSKDSEVILGVKVILEGQGLSVYVDWIEDPHLDRENVTPETAERLRTRMKQSKSLIYAHSNNSPDSKWMPWELGYFDGIKGTIAVFPIARTADETFKGQEFLGLYPYVDNISTSSLYVNRGKAPRSSLGQVEAGKTYRAFKDWMRGRAGVRFSG